VRVHAVADAGPVVGRPHPRCGAVPERGRAGAPLPGRGPVAGVQVGRPRRRGLRPLRVSLIHALDEGVRYWEGEAPAERRKKARQEPRPPDQPDTTSERVYESLTRVPWGGLLPL